MSIVRAGRDQHLRNDGGNLLQRNVRQIRSAVDLRHMVANVSVDRGSVRGMLSRRVFDAQRLERTAGDVPPLDLMSRGVLADTAPRICNLCSLSWHVELGIKMNAWLQFVYEKNRFASNDVITLRAYRLCQRR